jgi:hypothetical protein
VSDQIHIENNGMARCGICGEPCVIVLVGDPREVERDPLLVIRCIACAATEEAEAITADPRRKGPHG